MNAHTAAMATVRLIGPLRSLLGVPQLSTEATGLAQALEELRARLGARAAEVFEAPGRLKRPYVAVVNGQVVSQQEYEATPLRPEDEVSIVGALAGG